MGVSLIECMERGDGSVVRPNEQTLSAISMVATLYKRDCSLSIELTSDEIPRTAGRQMFVPQIPQNRRCPECGRMDGYCCLY